MAAILPCWQWLKGEAEWLEFSVRDSGVLQVFRTGEERALGAFGFTLEKDAPVRIRKLVATLGDSSSLEIKVVVEGKTFENVGLKADELGYPLRKFVHRACAFLIRYHPASGKLMVADEDGAHEVTAALNSTNENRPSQGKVKILIVDDSATIRKVLEKIFSSDPEVEVVAAVGLPSQVEDAIKKHRPDVVTLDIHLPEMNGVELLKRYLPKFPIPTVMISSISAEEGPMVLNALEAGAVDYIQKPSAMEIESVSPLILLKVKTAARASLQRAFTTASARIRIDARHLNQTRLVAIGSSTGGTEALREVFIRLPEEIPPIVVVQHIPAVFSKAFAERMNSLCPFEVVEGENGMDVRPGRVIIAPGGKQMRLKRHANGVRVEVDDSPPVNRHKPSVDVLMDSVAALYGQNAIGVILTGMGADGAKGLLAMKDAGASTFAQDEKSCVVYGMPQAAFKLGATRKMVPLVDIAATLVEELSHKKKAVG